ncbi:C-C chemokine receptor type 9-like [Bombina bombina]|uniref:C-C chemokine receptor type 9-like n=1 Tax=Bombina bombina TaxID=8345 RepID=UPI00235AF1F7|nr:C-C chemokine receptor type 9-like [Bombina bombina]
MMETQILTDAENEDGYMLVTPDYFLDDPGSFCEKSFVRNFAASFLPPIYWCVFFLGLLGNGLVIIIYVYYRRLKTITDTYLINLAIADLLFLVTLPFWAISASHDWIFKTALCKIVNSMYTINVYSGMMLLACISVDRYIAIVQATKAQKHRTRRIFFSKCICIFVWTLAVILSLPEILYSNVKEDSYSKYYCTMSYPVEIRKSLKVIALGLKVTVAFCIPFVIMIFCYSMIIPTLVQAKSFQKHKALKVIFALLTVFVLSQLPYNSLLIVKAWDASNATVADCMISKNLDIAYKVTQSIAFLHCCMNPFIYVFVGVKFRNDLFKILKMFSCISEDQWKKILKVEKSKALSEMLETKTGTLSL